MLDPRDKEIILECAARYGVSELLLFGSSLQTSSEANDIDLAVRGVPTGMFFRFYGELMGRLSKPVDLVDLESETGIALIARASGVQLYGKSA